MPGEWCMVMGAAASALDNDASRACGGAVVTLRAAARPTQSSKHPALVLGDEIIDFRIDNDNRELGRGAAQACPRARGEPTTSRLLRVSSQQQVRLSLNIQQHLNARAVRPLSGPNSTEST